MHDRQWSVVSVLLISGGRIRWNACNSSCIVEISGYLLDLILFFGFVSRLFAFSSFGFVFSISQTRHANTNFSEIGNSFSSFLLPRLASLLRLPFLFKAICYACNCSCIVEISGYPFD
jgi:hypothetical protein